MIRRERRRRNLALEPDQSFVGAAREMGSMSYLAYCQSGW
jgi:hypothetical protein